MKVLTGLDTTASRGLQALATAHNGNVDIPAWLNTQWGLAFKRELERAAVLWDALLGNLQKASSPPPDEPIIVEGLWRKSLYLPGTADYTAKIAGGEMEVALCPAKVEVATEWLFPPALLIPDQVMWRQMKNLAWMVGLVISILVFFWVDHLPRSLEGTGFVFPLCLSLVLALVAGWVLLMSIDPVDQVRELRASLLRYLGSLPSSDPGEVWVIDKRVEDGAKTSPDRGPFLVHMSLGIGLGMFALAIPRTAEESPWVQLTIWFVVSGGYSLWSAYKLTILDVRREIAKLDRLTMVWKRARAGTLAVWWNSIPGATRNRAPSFPQFLTIAQRVGIDLEAAKANPEAFVKAMVAKG